MNFVTDLQDRHHQAARITAANTAVSIAASEAVQAAINPAALQFLCGAYIRFHSLDTSHDAPMSLTSICQTTPRPVYPNISSPHLVVVKEVCMKPPSAGAFEPLSHVHPCDRLGYLRSIVASKLRLIDRLEAAHLMVFTVVHTADGDTRSPRLGGQSCNGLSTDIGQQSMNASASGPRVEKRAPLLALGHVALHEHSLTMFLFQQYTPTQTLEQLLQPRVEWNGKTSSHHPNHSAHPVEPPSAHNAGTTASSSGGSGGSNIRGATILCSRPVTVVTTGILREVARCLQQLHHLGIPHQHLRPSSVHVLVGGLRGPDVWLDNVGVLSTRSPLQDADLWRWYAPEISQEDLLTAEATDELCDHQLERWKRADVFALGLLIYFLLTGRRPFEADASYLSGVPYVCFVSQMVGRRLHQTSFETFGIPLAQQHTRCGGKRTRNPHGIKLEELLQKCLAWDALQRPTALEVSQELDAIFKLNANDETFEEDNEVPVDVPVPAVEEVAFSPHPAGGTLWLTPSLEASHGHTQQVTNRVATGSNGLESLGREARAHNSESMEGLHPSSSNNANTGSHLMIIQSGTGTSNHPFATPLHTMLSGSKAGGGVSELNQAGCSRFFLSQCQYDVRTQDGGAVKEAQYDDKELRTKILSMCFARDASVAPVTNPLGTRPNLPLMSGAVGAGVQQQIESTLLDIGGVNNWKVITAKFHELLVACDVSSSSTERYYPNREELMLPFQRNSLALKFWSGELQFRSSRATAAMRDTLWLPKDFLEFRTSRGGGLSSRDRSSREISATLVLPKVGGARPRASAKATILQKWAYIVAALEPQCLCPSDDYLASHREQLRQQAPAAILAIRIAFVCLCGIIVATVAIVAITSQG